MNQSIERYKAALAQSRESRFSGERPAAEPLRCVHSYTKDVDAIIIDVFTTLISPKIGDIPVCLIALGGYGRGELCPYSDIDLLILHDEKSALPGEIAAAIRFFWDIGLTMGCVVRTINECSRILGQDLATDTAFLENRLLAGDGGLYRRLIRDAVEPYFTKKKNRLVGEFRRILHAELYSPETALYRVEPDLKNGICALRDCHRLLWAERLRVGVGNLEELHTKSKFSARETKQFSADYAFYIGLRSMVHRVCGRRIDILESALQPDIARLYGFGDNGAGILMERFFKTVRGIRLFLLSYLEKSPAGTSLWTYFRKRVSAVEAAPGISMCEGIFFSAGKEAFRRRDSVWIMTLFRQALRYQASFSVELRHYIRVIVGTLSVDDFKSQEVGAIFREILSFEGAVGHVFQLMHETETLWRLIPQFEDLTCKVEYDSYHEFTIDQHILQTLVAADDLSGERDRHLRDLYARCPQKMLLRLGLLLHDIGKALPGDHVVNGAIIAETVCERLGLDEDESRRVKTLIYHHLDMSEFSLHREPEKHVLEEFAKLLEDRVNLDMLYLVTVLDIRCVGHSAWTSWKAYQLEQLYTSLGRLLEMPGSVQPAAPAGGGKSAVSYVRDTIPEDQVRHKEWLAALAPGELQIHCDKFHGFERLTVCGWDRMGFLRDSIGCISSEGYNILSAHIFSMPEGKVLDIFYVEPPPYPALSAEKRLSNLNVKWTGIKSGATTADALIAERLRLYPPRRLRPAPHGETEVTIDTVSSTTASIIEIRAADTFGLLHRIVQCFIKNGVNILSGRLSTRVDRANDVFYVTDANNGKIVDSRILENLRTDIIAALQATES
jgi:[protein-PII] uridylyltransferase